MRRGLLISILLHAGILAWAFGAFAWPERVRPAETKPVPVDLVTPSELTRLKAGLRDGKDALAALAADGGTATPARPKATPKPSGPRAARRQSAPPAAARPEKPAAKTAEAAPAPPTRKPPTRKPSTRKPVDKPALDKLVSRSLAEDKPAPKRPRPAPRKAKSTFDADRIAALLNKVPASAERRPAGAAPEPDAESEAKGQPSARDDRLTLSEIDALRQRISQCWAPPTGATGADALKVRLRLNLNRDGTLARQPQILNGHGSPFFQVAADSAVRAVWQCQPYQLPAAKYSLWRDMVLNFDPREMFGG